MSIFKRVIINFLDYEIPRYHNSFMNAQHGTQNCKKRSAGAYYKKKLIIIFVLLLIGIKDLKQNKLALTVKILYKISLVKFLPHKTN